MRNCNVTPRTTIMFRLFTEDWVFLKAMMTRAVLVRMRMMQGRMM